MRPRSLLRRVIDFLAGVAAHNSDVGADFSVSGDRVRGIVTLDGMHSEELTQMQKQGFSSQFTKFNVRFEAIEPG